jgi:hypothetical protein
MLMTQHQISRTILISLSATSLLFSGCSGEAKKSKTEHSRPAWQAHIPKNADILIVADIASLRSSVVTAGTDQTQNELLTEKAGFSQNDVSTLVVASDLDALPSMESLQNIVSMDESGQPDTSALQKADLTGLNATLLLLLDKTITWKQVRAATDVMFKDTPGATITEQTDAKRIKVLQASSTMPLYVELSESGNILILKTSEAMPSSDNGGDSLSSLFKKEQSIRANGPVRIALHASETMRRKIKESIGAAATEPQTDPTAAMLASVMTSFGSFAGLAMTLTPGDAGTELNGTFDLGTQENAVSAEAVIQNVLVPLITLTMTQYTESAPDAPPLLQDTKTSVQGSKVILRTHINAQTRPLPESDSAD